MSTSVARLIPSINEWRQPYLLSNLLLVTESLTLIAGNNNEPSLKRSYNRRTPVVVSSVTPLMPAAMRVQRCGFSVRVRLRTLRISLNSTLSVLSGDGALPAFSNSTPRWTSIVASPPSSRIMLGSWPSGQLMICSAQCQYSASDSPFQANTGTPAGASTCLLYTSPSPRD